MTIMKGNDPSIPAAAVGVDLRWLREYSLQLTDAPPWYSLCARLDGKLCGACDLGLPMSCACPESVPLLVPGALVLTPPNLFRVNPC